MLTSLSSISPLTINHRLHEAIAQMGIGFEWTIRAGDVLTMLGALLVAGGLLYNRGKDEANVTKSVQLALVELQEMKGDIKRFGEAIQKIAIQEVQIGLLMKWYDELRRGIGFVRGVGGVDREYQE